MNKIKTPSIDYAHLTEDGEVTVCGRKIYAYWVEPEDDNIKLCTSCEKENDKDEESNDVEPVRADEPKRRLASW